MATPPTMARRVKPLDLSGPSEGAGVVTSILVVNAVADAVCSLAWCTMMVTSYFPGLSKLCATR